MTYFAIAALVNTISSLILGSIVFFKDTKGTVNRAFFLYTIAITWWSFSYFIWQISNSSDEALFWCRSLMAGAIFIPVFYIRFIYKFLEKKYSRPLIIFFLIISCLFFVINFSSYFILDVRSRLNFEFWPTAGPLFGPFLGIWVLIVLYSLYLLFKEFKVNTGLRKTQISFVLWGTILGYGGGLTNYFLWFDVDIQPWGNILITLYALLVAYAILKYKLLNIKVIATEIGTFSVLLALFIQVLTSSDLSNFIIRGLIFVLALVGGLYLIKSVQHEIKQKEQLQELTTQLAQANNHLKELDEMKTEFVSLASHELLTPVSAIEGYLSMLLDEKMARVDDPKALRYLDNVYKSAKRLARLIADMLNISRIEEGRLLVEKMDVNLTELIHQVIDEVKFKADERKQKVVFENTATIPWATYADADKIKEVVVNIIGNSIKYSRDPGTITVTVEKVPTAQIQQKWDQLEEEIKSRPLDDQEAINSAVDPHYRQLVGDNQLVIKIKDQGIGIPVEELPRLFKKFHRVGNYSTQESQGTGLGLYISRALVELHHGRIWPDSEGEGKGSTFTFTLPDYASKEAVVELEKEVPQDKEKLKPLAKPMKMAEDI